MLLLWLALPALAFRAPDAHAPRVHAAPPEDVRLDVTPGLQLRLGASPAAEAFRERWGPTWIRWDERNATPRFIGLAAVPEARLAELVASVAGLARVDAAELGKAGARTHEGRTIVRFQRSHRGVPVQGDEVAVVITHGRIGAVWARLTPLGSLPDALPGERIVPLPDGRPVLAFRYDTPTQNQYIDRLGRVLYAWDARRYATLSVEYEPNTVGDALVTAPARSVTMIDSAGTTDITAVDGSHALSGGLDAWLDGPDLAVLDNGAAVHAYGTDSFTVTHTAVAPAAADVLHHFYVVQDWLRARWPTHAWLDTRVPATVRIPATCNAYYSSGTINFYAAGGGCADTGRIADVVYHEMGHGIHEYILEAGSFAGDVSEGSSDFTAATIRDNPVIGDGFFGAGSSIRELETDRRYPEDVSGEVHNDGLIWGSFLWNLREQWATDYGYDDGVEMTDLLFLGTLEQGPSLTDLGEAVTVADDDDGDFSNGTPHGCELQTLLAQHGLGPGPIGFIDFDHAQVGPQDSATTSYPVTFDLYALTPECAGLDTDSVALWYTTDDSLPVPGTRMPTRPADTGDTADTGLADTGAAPSDTADTADTGPTEPELAGYDGWTSLPLTHAGITFSGAFPRQAATSHVRYFMEARSTDGTQLVQTHAGRPEAVYDFWVGDRHPIWCEGFEAGFGDFTHGAGTPDAPDTTGILTDQWQTGAPAPSDDARWDPDRPRAGAAIAATALNGDYLPNNAQYLSSPLLDLSTAGPMLLFHQSRWLTVEDAVYDHATLSVGSRLLYRNGSGGGSTATLDTAWVDEDYSLDALRRSDSGVDLSAVRFDWALTSDMGLEYGGWALDDVCVYDLADPPGHYRTRDLTASDDAAAITVQWENPWIRPLAHTRLVRKAGGYPADADDGETLLDDTAPVIGAAMTYVDTAVEPGQVWYYALFAAPDADIFLGGVVEGQNADSGTVPVPDTGDTADWVAHDSEPDLDTATAEAPAGCGCGTTGQPAAAASLVALAALARRRRR